MKRLLLTIALGSLVGCRCNQPVTPVELGFQVSPTSLEFGRVLELTTATQTVTITSTGRGSLTITASTDLPFSVPASIELPGGSDVPLEVTFRAGTTEVNGTLTLEADGKKLEVALHATGVHPLECVASAPCRISEYDLPSNTCIERVAPDRELCTPLSTCLEGGQCIAGVCQGVPRSCDDHNACTVDSCSESLGCVNTMVSCPTPGNPCHRATCDTTSGCGEENAPDTSLCGELTCMNAQICFQGRCTSVVPPDGTPCAPPTPCQAEGTCQSQICVRPDAGILVPDWVQPLTGVPQPTLAAWDNNLYLQVCGLAADAGVDAGSLDGGSDGGPELHCGLLSFTGIGGFDRFATRYDDARERQLASPGPQGFALVTDAGVELRAFTNGSVRELIPVVGVCLPQGIAVTSGGAVWALSNRVDAGSTLQRFHDGGFDRQLELPGHYQSLAIDESGVVWAYSSDGGGLFTFETLLDGGFITAQRPAAAGVDSLSLARGAVFSGASGVTRPDGGIAVLFADAGVERLGSPLMVDFQLAVSFEERCEVPLTSCDVGDRELWVHALVAETGEQAWEFRIGTADSHPRLEQAALSSLKAGAVVTLTTQRNAPALEAFADGVRVLYCPFEPGVTVKAALFDNGSLFTVMSRDGGPTTLESFPVTTLSVRQNAWPQANGALGQRRAR